MPQLSIRFVEGSTSPSVLVDGSYSGPLVREFIADELRSQPSCEYFLKVFESLPPDAEYDHGFGNAIAVYVRSGIAYLEHVVAEVPAYKLPLSQLLAIARAWAVALASDPTKFKPMSFEVPV